MPTSQCVIWPAGGQHNKPENHVDYHDSVLHTPHIIYYYLSPNLFLNTNKYFICVLQESVNGHYVEDVLYFVIN